VREWVTDGLWSLSNLAAMLRFNLLTYRDLWAWLDAPHQVPILESQENQLELFPS
jgi:hypothetical protein